jgi:hypothetical protein
MRRVEGLAAAMEKMLTETYASQITTPGRYAADVTLRLYIRINPQQIVPDGTPDPLPEMPPEGNGSDDSHAIVPGSAGDQALSA